jgi:hypothetical protein
MNSNMDWYKKFNDEIKNAHHSRQEGNEGRARVCARRAAGIVISEFFLRNHLPDPSESAYDRLLVLSQIPEISVRVIEICQHLLQRVTPEHTLPYEADLIEDAIQLRYLILEE